MEHNGLEPKGIKPTNYERVLLQHFFGHIPAIITWNTLIPMLESINHYDCLFNIYTSRTNGHIYYSVVIWEGEMDQPISGYDQWEADLIQRTYKSIIEYINWSQKH